MMAIKSINALTHYTDYTIGHVHSGALGWNGFIAFGLIYFLVPRLWKTPFWESEVNYYSFLDGHYWDFNLCNFNVGWGNYPGANVARDHT